MNKNLIKVGDKVFAKTMAFGNRYTKNTHKNRKKYDRKQAKQTKVDPD